MHEYMWNFSRTGNYKKESKMPEMKNNVSETKKPFNGFINRLNRRGKN